LLNFGNAREDEEEEMLLVSRRIIDLREKGK